ncbi:solute carrier family 52, riboflavin transporter, member 3-A-like isoform X1 [Schistocerca gregaria]|uniref:solute carrier family 52, riboflavin transporter, member 3-A-like isoform X1 n=2 Tax=Schistocerca gregaria TaxID=7010 RepID=UPI00211F10D9|nr:solute carrier family 52, riboflavin transporter, member 3-A-like isoform X1 [Schistocerca gregaria]
MLPEIDEGTPLLLPAVPSTFQHKINMKFHIKGLSDREVVVDVLAVLFGIGTWLAINGMYVQLPLLVQTQPEGWNLPSFISIIVQIANIGPILYGLTQKFLPGKLRDSFIIYGLLIMGTIALLLMALLYEETTYIGGEKRSTSLLVLTFFIALVGCTSSVLFMPFMRNYRETYLTSYFVGEGLSGFLPSVFALIQGVGGNPTCVNQTVVNATNPDESYTVVAPYTPPPNFSTTVFIFILFAVLAISTISFALLNNLKVCKGERVRSQREQKAEKSVKDGSGEGSAGSAASRRSDLQEVTRLPRRTYVYLMVLVSLVAAFGNGAFPSIQSYSCLPYGNVAYHLAVSLSAMANPLACFLQFFLPKTSVRTISALSVVSAAFTVYIAVTALMSPSPPLVGHAGGEFLVVISWVIFTGAISYMKLAIASIFRTEGGRSLFWCGAAQQMGSAVASVVTFFLVNYAGIFHSYSPC